MKLSDFVSCYEDSVYSLIENTKGISVSWYRNSTFRCTLMTPLRTLPFDLCSSFRDIFLCHPIDSDLYDFSFSTFNLSNDIICFECMMYKK